MNNSVNIILNVETDFEPVSKKLYIYNSAGGQVYVETCRGKSLQQHTWDGTNLSGEEVDPGIYYVKYEWH